MPCGIRPTHREGDPCTDPAGHSGLHSWDGRRNNRGAVQWTPEAIIEAIQRWTTETGWPPSSSMWLKAENGHPHSNSVINVLGSFPAALELAGCQRPLCSECGTEILRKTDTGLCGDCREKVGQVSHAERRRLRRAAIIKAMQDWYHRYGESPTSAEWSPWHAKRLRTRPPRPRAPFWSQDVNRVFGTWPAALEAAGLPPTRKAGQYKRKAR
jgi:hypothetical protein